MIIPDYHILLTQRCKSDHEIIHMVPQYRDYILFELVTELLATATFLKMGGVEHLKFCQDFDSG